MLELQAWPARPGQRRTGDCEVPVCNNLAGLVRAFCRWFRHQCTHAHQLISAPVIRRALGLGFATRVPLHVGLQGSAAYRASE